VVVAVAVIAAVAVLVIVVVLVVGFLILLAFTSLLVTASYGRRSRSSGFPNVTVASATATLTDILPQSRLSHFGSDRSEKHSSSFLFRGVLVSTLLNATVYVYTQFAECQYRMQIKWDYKKNTFVPLPRKGRSLLCFSIAA
jgi:hypothetical protein